MSAFVKTTSAFAVLAMLTAPAFAGNVIPAPADPVLPVPMVQDTDWTGFYVGLNGGVGRADDGSFTPDTTLYGVQIGYLHDFGTLVAGGELAFTKIDQDVWGDELSSIRLKGRLGYDAGRVLPYVTAGVSSYRSDLSGNGTAYLAGAGVEYAVTDHLRVGLEYLWEGNNNFEYSAGPSFPLSDQEIVLRVNYAF